jgi:hypothetical protein
VRGAYVVPRNRAECLKITRRWSPSPAVAEGGGYDA